MNGFRNEQIAMSKNVSEEPAWDPDVDGFRVEGAANDYFNGDYFYSCTLGDGSRNYGNMADGALSYLETFTPKYVIWYEGLGWLLTWNQFDADGYAVFIINNAEFFGADTTVTKILKF
jgi:hypothetical protein